MRIVVYPHMLEIGGSQLNAIELAAAVRDLGHEVVVFGQHGPLEERIAELDLELVQAPRPRGRPSPRVMRALCELVDRRAVQLVHGYEWTAALEAYWGPRTRSGVPAVATVMSMAVAPFLPRDMPLVVGTEQIADHERRAGRSAVTVIEPPVDVDHNAPGAVDVDEFRRRHGLDAGAQTVVCVTRLAAELKLEGVLCAIDAVADLAATSSVQLVLVGDGPTRDTVAAAAERANARAGRRIAILTGSLQDPRPAYAAADVCLGMGGSALRAMAFGRPLVVQGESGFWELLTPDTVERFLWTGWYGVGDGPEHGRARLAALLRPLLADDERRANLGRYARELVEKRFSLRRAAERQLALYEAALGSVPIRRRHSLVPATASASGLAAYRVRRRLEQVVGRGSVDDFNSRPVATLSR
jgi:glycosyltransferase involved in cell wall biosynthesis